MAFEARWTRPSGALGSRAFRVLRAWVVALTALMVTSTAHAELPGPKSPPLVIIDVESDDAEDQAEALSAALRSRVRAAPGMSLAEANQTMGALLVALRCPPRPDAPCLQRVGDLLKIDRFLWGTMTKGPVGQVTVEAHLWARGKSDVSLKDTYSDNLRDPGDEALRKIAARIIDRLVGVASAPLVVHANVDQGTVLLDGTPRGALEHGVARLEAPVGSRMVEIRASGHVPWQQAVRVALPSTEIDATLVVGSAPPVEKPFPVRRVIAWSAVGVGAIMGAVATQQTVSFLGARGELDDIRARVPKSLTDVCAEEAETNPDAVLACRKVKEARRARTNAVIAGLAGAALVGTGVVLLLTEPRSDATKAGVRVAPMAGPGALGLMVDGRF